MESWRNKNLYWSEEFNQVALKIVGCIEANAIVVDEASKASAALL